MIENVKGKVLAILTEKGDLALTEKEGGPSSRLFGLVLDKTVFYAESGGQVNDLGTITLVASSTGDSVIFNVHDVQVYAGYVLHSGTVVVEDDDDNNKKYGDLVHVGQSGLLLSIDKVRTHIHKKVEFFTLCELG